MTARFDLRPAGPELAARYREAGYWIDQSFGDLFHAQLAANRRLPVCIWSRERPFRGTVADVEAIARRLAGGLARRGVGPGDVVAFQIPNWVEAAAAFWGLNLLGAVLVPVVHFYGPKELRFVLEQSGAKALITASRFRRSDYLAGLASFRDALPALETVVVVDGEGRLPRDAVSFSQLLEADPLERPPAVDPAAPAVVAYTSGTTAAPKGVVHSHLTLAAEARQLVGMMPAPERPHLVGAPVTHAMGMLGGLLTPLLHGTPIHLLDLWEPERVLEIMVEADLSAGSGATYFLTSLLDAPGFGPEHRKRMTRLGMGGSPVPAAVADRAEALGLSMIRSYGSTEHPSTTGSTHVEPAHKRKYTDGHALPGVEIRLVDERGRDVPPGSPGEIWSRGPDRFVGYTDPALTRAAIDAEGWYATGDIGVLDEDGYLTITDRVKDIIIRGGENVSAAEVEELLARMPGVTEVAVVAAPDPRLGEHGCAFFRMQPGAGAPDLAAVRRHLEAAGLARQKWPEELRSVDEFDRTPSGKIKKYVLRDRLRARG